MQWIHCTLLYKSWYRSTSIPQWLHFPVKLQLHIIGLQWTHFYNEMYHNTCIETYKLHQYSVYKNDTTLYIRDKNMYMYWTLEFERSLDLPGIQGIPKRKKGSAISLPCSDCQIPSSNLVLYNKYHNNASNKAYYSLHQSHKHSIIKIISLRRAHCITIVYGNIELYPKIAYVSYINNNN